MRKLTSMTLAVVFWGGFTNGVLAQGALEKLEKDLEGRPSKPGKEAAAPAPDDDETGYLGVFADDRDENGKGVRIVEVIARGPAAQAKLKVGDLVKSIDGNKIATMDDFAKAVGQTHAGGMLRFEVERGENRYTLKVTLGHRPPPAERPVENFGRIPGDLPPSGELPNADRPMGLLGVVVDDVTPEVQKALGLSEARGAVVLRFSPDSAAEQAGVPLEAVIVAVDGLQVDSPADLRRLVAQAGPGSEITLSYEFKSKLSQRAVRLAPATAAPPLLARPMDDPAPYEPDDESDAQRIDRLEQRVHELEVRLLELERLLRAAAPAPRSNKGSK